MGTTWPGTPAVSSPASSRRTTTRRETRLVTPLDQLAARARSLLQSGHRAILGVTGTPGAGKSTLAEGLLRLLRPTPPAGSREGAWVAYVPMDGFHLADVELA